jgi:hypothetical protein
MKTSDLIKTATLDAIHTLWTQGGNRDDAWDAGSNLYWTLSAKLILDAPDLRADTVEDIVKALPSNFCNDFRFHMLQGFEEAAHEDCGLSDDDFNPFED